MKHFSFLLITFSLVLFSFKSINDKENYAVLAPGNCNQSYTIDGGPNCSYNGTTSGWCSESEFNEYANNIYSLEECGGDGYNPHKQ